MWDLCSLCFLVNVDRNYDQLQSQFLLALFLLLCAKLVVVFELGFNLVTEEPFYLCANEPTSFPLISLKQEHLLTCIAHFDL